MMPRLLAAWFGKYWWRRSNQPPSEAMDLLSEVLANNSERERLYESLKILCKAIVLKQWALCFTTIVDYVTGIRPHKVLSIVGRDARALAKNLYTENKGQFICAVEVHMSTVSHMRTTLGEILRQVTGCDNNYDDLDETQLIRRINEALMFTRYLVVVYDIWEEIEWKLIAGAFPMEYSGSGRVITTTRRNNVAVACCSGKLDLVYKLESPWPEVEDATATATTGDGWEWSVRVMETEVNDPPNLLDSRAWKDCVLYLSTLPGNQKFERENLVGKWVAGELVAREDVAYSYFDELVNRNVIHQHPQGEHYSRFGEAPTYYIRPTDLEVLRMMSQNKADFVTFIPVTTTSSSERLCGHLVLGASQPAEAAAAILDLRSAKSVTARGHVRGVVLPLRHLEKHHRLLVLDLEGCQDVTDCDVVGICCHLTLLRYLSLRRTRVTGIPVEVQNLTSLETLDVREVRLQQQQLPEEVALLPKLRRLLFSGGVKFLGQGQGASSPSSSIKVLSAVHESEVLRCLAKEVRDLVVVCDGKDLPEFSLTSSLPAASIPHLEMLKVLGRCVRLPAWIKDKQLRTVTVLDIRMCQINDDDDVEALGSMALLRTLTLSLVSLPRKQIDIRSWNEEGGKLFQSLRVFALDCRVPWVCFQPNAMPALESLYLKLYATAGGDNLKLPSGIFYLASLCKVTLHPSQGYAKSAAVTHTVAAVEQQLARHTGNTAVALFVGKTHKITNIQAPVDTITLFLSWYMRNFLDCVVMPTFYLLRWCYKRSGEAVNGEFLFYIMAIALLLLLFPRLLSYYLLPKITNMVAHNITRRAFASRAILLPLPLVFYAMQGKSKWLRVLHFSIFILFDVCSYQPFTHALPMMLPIFWLLPRGSFLQTGRIDW